MLLSQIQSLCEGLAEMPVTGGGRKVLCEKWDVIQPHDRVTGSVQDRRGQEPVVQVQGQHTQPRISE